MQCDDGFPGSGRAGYPSSTRELPLDDGTLRGMQKDTPALPWVFERLPQLLLVNDQADAPLGVGMSIGIGNRRRRRYGQGPGGRVLQQRFRRLGRQVLRQFEEPVLARGANVAEPV